jgi:hypothetical protein
MTAVGSHRPRRTANAASITESDGCGTPPSRRRHHDRPLHVHIEFVVVDGEAGKALARHQGAVIRQVLEWVHDHPAGTAQHTRGTDGTV